MRQRPQNQPAVRAGGGEATVYHDERFEAGQVANEEGATRVEAVGELDGCHEGEDGPVQLAQRRSEIVSETDGGGEGEGRVGGHARVGEREEVFAKGLDEEGEKRGRVEEECREALEGRGNVEKEARGLEKGCV